MKTHSKLILATSIIISLTSMYIAVTKANASETIKVYSERQPFLIEPLIKAVSYTHLTLPTTTIV